MKKLLQKPYTEEQIYIMKQLYEYSTTTAQEIKAGVVAGLDKETIGFMKKSSNDLLARGKVWVLVNAPNMPDVEVYVEFLPVFCLYLFQYLQCQLVRFVVDSNKTPIRLVVESTDTQTLELLSKLNRTKINVFNGNLIIEVDD